MTCSVQTINIYPKDARGKILDMAFVGNSGHIGCAFSVVEIIHTLYSSFLKVNPMNPKDNNRDIFVMSKGHGVMALYIYLAEIGYIEKSCLEKYFSDGSPLHGLAEFGVTGIEASGGSLGHGICVATGMALGLQRKKSEQRVYCLVGDGEANEGTFWESLHFTSHHELKNLTIIVDANGLQAMGFTKDVMNLRNLENKFTSFGFFANTCNGHNTDELKTALSECISSNKPSVLIANTIKGKGVKTFENNNDWHYKKMDRPTYEIARKEVLA